MRTITSLATVLLVSSVAAQNCWYAPSNTPTVGTCNSIPLGQSSSRYQCLMTADDLGQRPTIIRALGFASCAGGTMTASRMLIRFNYFQGATLGTDFATNLGTGEVTMLNTTSFSWTYAANTWSDIPLTGTFTYIPTRGNLLIDVEFEGASGGASFHRDTRQRVYANNWTGTPPATGSSSSAAAKVRVTDGNACSVGAFTNYGRGCGAGPLAVAGTGTPTVGTTVTLAMTGGRASSAGAYFLGATRLNIDLSTAGMTGCFLNTDLLAIFGTAFDGSGAATPIQLPIPADNTLVGAIINWSGFNLDASANPFGITTANGVEMKIAN